ncbi:unnamed protein product [Ectocarpus sp. 12 AP-2014]
MLKHIVMGKEQAAPAGTSYSGTRRVASSGARDMGSHAPQVLGAVAVASAATDVAKPHLLSSAMTTVAKLNGNPLGGARPAIMIATATETLAAPVPVAVLRLTSSTPTESSAAVFKTADNTTTDVTPLLLSSSKTRSTAAPSRGRSTSPRAPSTLSRSPSPQCSGTAVHAAAVGASSWSTASRPAASSLGGDFGSAAPVKYRISGQKFQAGVTVRRHPGRPGKLSAHPGIRCSVSCFRYLRGFQQLVLLRKELRPRRPRL